MLDIEVVRARQVGSTCKFEGKLSVVERGQDVWYNRLLINIHAENLALLVDSDDSIGGLVLSGDEDGLARDTVHIDARASFQVVKVDKAILGDHVDDAVFLGYLHGHGEIVRGLWREIDINVLLGIRRIGGLVVDLDDVQLERL